MLLFKSLDLRPLHSILWKNLHVEGAGRPVQFDPECDLRALMLRQLEQIPYVKDLVKRLRRSRDLRSACGYQSIVLFNVLVDGVWEEHCLVSAGSVYMFAHGFSFDSKLALRLTVKS